MPDAHFNRVELRGIAGMPELQSAGNGAGRAREFWCFPVTCERLSGASDAINVRAMRSYIPEPPFPGEFAAVTGELRSYNLHTDEGHSRLVITLFARSLLRSDSFPDERSRAPRNVIELSGAVCRPPVWRRTPLGREICDVMLAVNRPPVASRHISSDAETAFGTPEANSGARRARVRRSDYLPCIAWGANARDISLLPVGSPLAFTGRVQSREYVKKLPDGDVSRVAYEVSIGELL